MTSSENIIVLILLLGAGTFLIRLSFLPFAERWQGQGRMLSLLRPIPAAAMAALIVPGLLFTDGKGAPDAALSGTAWAGMSWEGLLPGAVALAVALRTRNTLMTIACGMIALWGEKWLLGL